MENIWLLDVIDCYCHVFGIVRINEPPKSLLNPWIAFPVSFVGINIVLSQMSSGFDSFIFFNGGSQFSCPGHGGFGVSIWFLPWMMLDHCDGNRSPPLLGGLFMPSAASILYCFRLLPLLPCTPAPLENVGKMKGLLMGHGWHKAKSLLPKPHLFLVSLQKPGEENKTRTASLPITPSFVLWRSTPLKQASKCFEWWILKHLTLCSQNVSA